MTIEELLRLGGECEAAGDSQGAEAAYREADELHDAEGAILLGLILKRRGESSGATDAFQRAEGRGHPEAGSCLGNLLWENADLEGAKAAYERSIAAGSADAVLNLGLMLAQQGAVDEALPHLHAAEENGAAEASWAIGKLLEDQEDFEGAASAYRRGADGGDANAAYGLGAVLEKLGDRNGARAAMQRASELGHEGAARIADMMDFDADAESRIAPLVPGEERLLQTVHRADGNRNDIYLSHRRATDDATMGTGEPVNFVAIIRYTDQDPDDASPAYAWQRGPTEISVYRAVAEAFVNVGVLPGTTVSLDPDVQWLVDRIREKNGPAVSPTETAAKWAGLYVAACGEVLTAAKSCLEVANRAIGARNMADTRPQHEISIKSFTDLAERAEHDYAPLHRAFEEACTVARDAAAQLLSIQDPVFSEMLLATTVEQEVLDNVATVKGLLGASYGPTPAGFLQGIAEANALMQNPPDEGNIYRPAPVAESDERTCPWCAETIKAAAVICRFCGRDVQMQANPERAVVAV